MPINAGPEFELAMEKYSAARTTKEKIQALQEAIKYMPKHKGAENLRAQLFRRLAELKRDLQKEKERKSGGGGIRIIPKDGFQAVLFGFPNSGKTYLLSKLTNAPVKPTEYPLATTEPTPGMLVADGGKVQLVEIPSYFEGYGESKMGRIGLATIRSTDAVALVIDLTQDPIRQVKTLVEFLRDEDIFLNKRPPNVRVERKYSGGYQFIGESFMEGDRRLYQDILQTYGIHNAVITFLEHTTPEEFMLAINESARFLPAILIGTKAEQAPKKHIDAFNAIPNVNKILFRNDDIDGTKRDIFKALGLIRVYTKPPRGKPSEEPIVLRAGSTVADIAERIFPNKEIKQARVWGSTRFPGQTVGLDYVLADGDIVELRV
ncbi:MAG: TGS domain-containing protein [Candidatus Diapherotrites archaeon]|nr:TGS domain-containing protein [Candidatus Diapherotrites archaeon]